MSNIIFSNNLSKFKIIIYFLLIISSGFIFRYIFFPFEIPLILDSLGYFWYGIDLSVNGKFPTEHDLPNNLWPSLLSIFFNITNSEKFLDYMVIQRNLSIVFSVFTAIPIYFLAKKFIRKEFALIAPLFFIFEPRIIENSLAGITEPFFIFMVVSSLALFFSKQKKLILLSFVISGLFCLIRYEGLMITFGMITILCYRFRNEKKNLIYVIFAICIFLLVITPMSIIRTDTMGYDGIFSHVTAGAELINEETFQNVEINNKKFFPELGIINFTKFFGWILIPTFTIFFPLGIFYSLKNKQIKKIELIIIGIFALIPALYAFSREILDPRYLFVIMPILAILSAYVLQIFSYKIKKPKIIVLIIIILIIIISLVFFQIKIPNYEYEKESYLLALKIYEIADGINASYYPEGAYLRVTQLDNSIFPITSIQGKSDMIFIPSNNIDNIDDYITYGKNKGLTHLIVDELFIYDSKRTDDFLDDVFINEEKYPYLIKEFDSLEQGYSHHLKIFKIDFKKFNENLN
ncbi:MAG: hypothetical protein CXT78_00060 [Thaumarchaeota archaeon]|nr:MAG: hypothetical protein CXT78_00060 [Nitrososphaerota archaeon]